MKWNERANEQDKNCKNNQIATGKNCNAQRTRIPKYEIIRFRSEFFAVCLLDIHKRLLVGIFLVVVSARCKLLPYDVGEMVVYSMFIYSFVLEFSFCFPVFSYFMRCVKCVECRVYSFCFSYCFLYAMHGMSYVFIIFTYETTTECQNYHTYAYYDRVCSNDL